MNDLDMELQTIRQKLQTLKASPPETVTAPWNPPRLTSPSPDLAQVTTAIETLRQRSGQPLSSPVADSSLQQFDAALSAVDHLAEQQRQALQRLQSIGIHLIQQTQPGASPDVDDIARFLTECQTIQIPTIQRDADGYLDLGYHTIYLQEAEPGTEGKFRVRSQLFQHSLGNTQEAHKSSAVDRRSYPANSLIEDIKHFCQATHRTFQHWQQRHLSSAKHSRGSQFTLVDGAIWCLGAVIARIILSQLFLFYPALWTPIAFLLIAGIIFTLYRAVLSSRPNPVIGYRALMIIIGLLIGGRFS